jgi:hypothetical protein
LRLRATNEHIRVDHAGDDEVSILDRRSGFEYATSRRRTVRSGQD